MQGKLLIIGVGMTCLLLGENEAREKAVVSKTEKMDFPAGGTLRLENSTGELVIEGWDQPGVEITTTKSRKDVYSTQDRAKATRELDRVSISAKRSGDELDVATAFPHHRAFPFVTPFQSVTNFDLEYRIKVPRSAKLIVGHKGGDVHIDDIAGTIQVKDVQGLITLRLVGDTPRAIEARSRVGSVNSDFPGNESRRPWPFGHEFVEGSSANPQNLDLKVGFGDIVILKAHEPVPPAPVSK
jgi:hypothetical protein